MENPYGYLPSRNGQWEKDCRLRIRRESKQPVHVLKTARRSWTIARTTMTFLAVLATLGLAAGCSMADPKIADSDSMSTAEPSPSDGCVEDATKSVEGGFCVGVPTTFTASAPFDKDNTSRTYAYSDGAGRVVTIVVRTEDDPDAWDREVRFLTRDSNDTSNRDQKSMDLPGGGMYWSWFDEDDGFVWATGLTHKGNKIIFCRTKSKDAAAPDLDICKSIRAI